MGNGRKKLRIEIFFEQLFSNLGKLIITNLLFAIPSAAVFTLYYFLNKALFDGIHIIFSMTAVILLYPFYAGVVMAVRNIVSERNDAPLVRSFFSAIRHNFPVFLLHGVVICGATILSYSALVFYIQLLSQSWIMYVALFFCILVVLLVMYASFYLPLMTLTYDIKLRYIYKNCLLMSFGEFKHNLAATLALMVLAGICLTATAFLPSAIVLLIVVCALWALFIPSIATYCYTFCVYQPMVDIIENKDAAGKEISEKIKAASAPRGADKPVPQPEEEDFSDIDIRQLKDTDDFIFHNGRMVRQSTLLKILREKEAQKEVEKHD